jgi:hypothetical protein
MFPRIQTGKTGTRIEELISSCPIDGKASGERQIREVETSTD